MAYPPSGPSVPPPPGGSTGGQPPYGSQPGPFQGGPGPQPKKGLSGGIIAAIAGVLVLLLAVCCLGGFLIVRATGDDEPDSTPTSETSETSEEPTQEPTQEEPTQEPTSMTEEPDPTDSSTSSPAGTSVDFPASYDGWSNSAPDSTTLASYAKDGNRFSVIASSYLKPSNYEQLWDSVKKYGDVSCGRRSSSGSDIYCTAEKDGATFLATSPDLSEADLASAVQGMLDEL
ncbi:hypothetical protein [Janibacter sp. GS2]|uniref:hypothetical protein n=1 Tax=Janibacter sp. GS2 TaxID=3442646 RepID=UPI003EBA0A2D